MPSNNNINSLISNLNRLVVNRSSTARSHHAPTTSVTHHAPNTTSSTRKRKREANKISISKNKNSRQTKKARIYTSDERRRNFLINKKKVDAAEEAIDSYKKANECLTSAEGIYVSSSLTAAVNAMRTDLPVESREIVIQSANNLVDVVKSKLELLRQATMSAEENARKASLPDTTADEAEEEAYKADISLSEAIKQKNAVTKAAKAVDTAVKNKIREELNRIRRIHSTESRAYRLTVRSRRRNGEHTLNEQ